MILLFLKSIIIGIANIIPGVSGGTLAVMLNVYDPITEKIGNFFLVDRKTKISYFLYLLVVDRVNYEPKFHFQDDNKLLLLPKSSQEFLPMLHRRSYYI